MPAPEALHTVPISMTLHSMTAHSSHLVNMAVSPFVFKSCSVKGECLSFGSLKAV
jgi:hypothetical protein